MQVDGRQRRFLIYFACLPASPGQLRQDGRPPHRLRRRQLPYRALWFPFGPIFSLVLCIVVIGGQGWGALTGDAIKWHDLAVAYIGVPVFALFYLGYKLSRKTKVVPLAEADLSRDH